MKSLLVSYSGHITTPSSLMLDNGLASLAANLLRSDIETLVLDLNSVSLIKKLKPTETISFKMAETAASISQQMQKGKDPDASLVKKLKLLEKDFEQEYDKRLEAIADEVIETADRFNAGFVGIKLWNGDGFTGSIRIAQRLREHDPGLKIYGGGPHVDWFMQHIFRYPGAGSFDALAYAEGEETIVELAKGTPLNQIPNLILKDGTITPVKRVSSLDSLAMPNYDPKVYPAIGGDQKIKTIVIDESRGCPYVCNFCIQPVKSGNVWRLKSAARVVDEMQEAIDKHGINVFRYAGSSTPPSHAIAIAKEIIKRNLDVIYSSFASAKGFSQEDMHTLKESGCVSMFFGLESGHPDILKGSIGKKATLEEFRKTIRYAKEAGIFTIASVIIPAPHDTPETLEATFNYLCDIRPDSVPLSPPGMMQRTPWGENPEKYNFKIRQPEIFPIDFMSYKIRLFFPGILWDEAPYSINGMGSKEFLMTMSRFGAKLEQAGILTAVPDDLYVAAKCAGMDPRTYRDETRKILLSHDHASMQRIVNKSNEMIQYRA